MELSFPNIKECNIDMLLMDLFYSSDDFVKWFLEQLHAQGVPNLKNFELIKCISSYYPAGYNGETDIYLEFKINNNEDLVILLENKINAKLDNDQAERYRERKKDLEVSKISAYTIITAPEKYFPEENNNLGFDCKLTYQKILEKLKSLKHNDSFKKTLLEAAIKKSEMVHTHQECPYVTSFWEHYYQLVKNSYKELQMEAPGSRPARSTTVNFYPWGQERKPKIVHQMNGGRTGPYLYLLIPVLDNNTYEDIVSKFSTKKHYKFTFVGETKNKVKKDIPETKIQIFTPKLNPSKPFFEYESEINETVKKAKELYDLWCGFRGDFNFNGKSYEKK